MARRTKAQRARAYGGHGPSIKNGKTYDALVRAGHSKSSAAAISNAALNKGYKRGKHKRK